jgi:crotonobetainyl-CoA:carnitine CoA-transferase CaiB-like acyl-CoA transferase
MELHDHNPPTQRIGALSGLRVVDLSRVLAGPLCTQCLGDHGAVVIKVEPPTGDETRSWGPFSDGGSAYFSGVNRNKANIAVDLSKADGRDVLLRLLKDADVLVHNFKPGTLERWGIGFDDVLSPRFPRLIYCHISGFGETGPLGGMPGYDSVVQAMAGCMSVNGQPDGEPTRVGMSIVDIGTGLNAVIAILMAVYERERSGRGQKLDVSLYDCALTYLHPHAAGLLQAGVEPRRSGNEHPSIAPYEQFSTASGPVFLGVGNDGQFVLACRLLGCDEILSDDRFKTNALRVSNRSALHALLRPVLLQQNAEELSRKLLEKGVPAGPVLGVSDVLSAPHTAHRDMVVESGTYRALGIPIKMSRTPGSVRTPPQNLGELSRDVCRSVGLTDEEIDDLIKRRIVFASVDPSPQGNPQHDK